MNVRPLMKVHKDGKKEVFEIRTAGEHNELYAFVINGSYVAIFEERSDFINLTAWLRSLVQNHGWRWAYHEGGEVVERYRNTYHEN